MHDTEKFIGSFKTRGLWSCKAFCLAFESFIWSCGLFCSYRSHRFYHLLLLVNFHRSYGLLHRFMWKKKELSVVLVAWNSYQYHVAESESYFMVRHTGPKPRESNKNISFVVIQAQKKEFRWKVLFREFRTEMTFVCRPTAVWQSEERFLGSCASIFPNTWTFHKSVSSSKVTQTFFLLVCHVLPWVHDRPELRSS